MTYFKDVIKYLGVLGLFELMTYFKDVIKYLGVLGLFELKTRYRLKSHDLPWRTGPV